MSVLWVESCWAASDSAACGGMYIVTGVSLVWNVLGTETHSEVHFQKCWVQWMYSFFLSLVPVMKSSERRHTHVANYKGIKCIQNLSGKFYEENVSEKHRTYDPLFYAPCIQCWQRDMICIVSVSCCVRTQQTKTRETKTKGVSLREALEEAPGRPPALL